MRKLVLLLVAVAATACSPIPVAAASATVAVTTPAGIYAPVDVTVDAASTISVNTAALAPSGNYVTSGPCVLTRAPGYNASGPVNGATCTGPGTVHFTTTGQLTSTCAYDGAILEGLHLTIKVNDVVQYDQQLRPNPIVCYVTTALQATVAWTAPMLTLTNTQARPSAATVATVADPAWNFSAHTFVVPAGLVCGKNLVDINPSRFITQLVERGFKCQGIVPANTVLVVAGT